MDASLLTTLKYLICITLTLQIKTTNSTETRESTASSSTFKTEPWTFKTEPWTTPPETTEPPDIKKSPHLANDEEHNYHSKENLLDLSSFKFKWDCSACETTVEEDSNRIQNLKTTFLYTFYKSKAKDDSIGKTFDRKEQKDNANLLELQIPTLAGGYGQCGDFDRRRDLRIKWENVNMCNLSEEEMKKDDGEYHYFNKVYVLRQYRKYLPSFKSVTEILSKTEISDDPKFTSLPEFEQDYNHDTDEPRALDELMGKLDQEYEQNSPTQKKYNLDYSVLREKSALLNIPFKENIKIRATDNTTLLTGLESAKPDFVQFLKDLPVNLGRDEGRAQPLAFNIQVSVDEHYIKECLHRTENANSSDETDHCALEAYTIWCSMKFGHAKMEQFKRITEKKYTCCPYELMAGTKHERILMRYYELMGYCRRDCNDQERSLGRNLLVSKSGNIHQRKVDDKTVTVENLEQFNEHHGSPFESSKYPSRFGTRQLQGLTYFSPDFIKTDMNYVFDDTTAFMKEGYTEDVLGPVDSLTSTDCSKPDSTIYDTVEAAIYYCKHSLAFRAQLFCDLGIAQNFDWNAENCSRKKLGPAIGDAIVKKCESIFSKMKGGRSGKTMEIKQGICYRDGNMNLVDEILQESNTFLTENKQRHSENTGKKSGQTSTGNGRISTGGVRSQEHQKLNDLCKKVLGVDCDKAEEEGRESAKDFEKGGRSGGELEEKVKQMTVAKRILERCGRITTQCSPGAKIFDNNNLEMPRVVWERGLDPVIMFDLFEQQEISANTPLCFMIQSFEIQQYVAPFKYGDHNSIIKFPTFELQLTDFKTQYPASNYYTAANAESRLWCKKCSCKSRSADTWEAGNAESACNQTLERYYGSKFSERILEMHPMTWPTCNYFSGTVQLDSSAKKAAFNDNGACTSISEPILSAECLIVNFPVLSQIYDVMEFKADTRIYKLNFHGKMMQGTGSKMKVTDLNMPFTIMNRREIHQSSQSSNYIEGNGGFGTYNNSREGIMMTLSVTCDDTLLDQSLSMDSDRHCWHKQRGMDLSFISNAPIYDVRSGFEYMIAPSKLDSWATDPANGKQVGFGWYQWNYNRQRWGILDTQNGKKIPDNMKNAIEKYLGFGDDKLEVLQTLCPEDAQIGIQQPNDDIPNEYRNPGDKNSGIVKNNDKKFKEKIDRTTLLGDLNKFSQNKPQFVKNLRDLHKRVYQPIPIENAQQYSGIDSIVQSANAWDQYVTDAGAVGLEVDEFAQATVTSSMPRLKNVRFHMEFTDRAIFKDASSKLADANIIAVKKMKVEPRLLNSFGVPMKKTGGSGSPIFSNAGNSVRTCDILESCEKHECWKPGVDCATGAKSINHDDEVEVVVLGISEPKGHIMGRVDWIHDEGGFVTELKKIEVAECWGQPAAGFEGLPIANKQECQRRVAQAVLKLPGFPTQNELQKKPMNKMFYWSAKHHEKNLENYAKNAHCDIYDLFTAHGYDYLENTNEKKLTPDSSFVDLFSKKPYKSSERAAILFIPVQGYCMHGLGKIRVLVKALGKKTLIRYINCDSLLKKKNFKAAETHVLSEINVDYRPATKRQALYSGCCDICWPLDHLRPCAFACPNVYTTTYFAAILLTLGLVFFLFSTMYCLCACKENRRAGIPNWWCALPCFRLEHETNVVRRVYSETITETEYSYDEDDEDLLSDEDDGSYENEEDGGYEDTVDFNYQKKKPIGENYGDGDYDGKYL